MKLLKRFLIVIALSVLTLFGTSFILAHFYEDEVEQYVIERLNRKLATDLSVADIHLTLIAKFPNASLEFERIWAKENIVKLGAPDTLFYFEHVYLQFNVLDIINGKYDIRQIDLENGFARLHVDEAGYDNWHILKQDTDTTDNSFLLQLEDVGLSDVDFTFSNRHNSDSIRLFGHDVAMSGSFSSDIFDMDIEGRLDVHQLKLSGTSYLSNRATELATRLNINKPKNKYTIDGGELEIERHVFTLSGSVTDNDDHLALNLGIQGVGLDIESGVALLPEPYRSDLEQYDGEGKLAFECKLQGKSGRLFTPGFSATFKVENGTIVPEEEAWRLQAVNLEGSYTNGALRNRKTSKLELSSFSAKVGVGQIRARIRVTDFDHPQLAIQTRSDLDLAALHAMFPNDTISETGGQIHLNASWEGTLNDLNNVTAKDLISATASGTVKLADVFLRLKNRPILYDHINGEFSVHDNNVLIKTLKGRAASSDFALEGLFRNVLPWLFLENQDLTVEARLSSKNLNLNELLTSSEDAAPGKEKAYVLAFPQRIRFNLKLDIGHLAFKRFEADDLRGVAQFVGDEFSAKPLSFAALNGHTVGDFSLTSLPDGRFQMVSNLAAKDIDIKQLFWSCEDFGQAFLTSRHLVGKADADIAFSSIINPMLEFDEPSIHTDAEITIRDGELVAFEPMKSISDYIKGNRLLKTFILVDELEKKLEHIRFSELHNIIRIRDRVVELPNMAINSSALRMEIAGTHSFDNEINYRLNFYLADILKKKNVRSDLTELPQDEKGRTRLYLTMTGTVDDFEINYEKMNLLAGPKEAMRQEGQTVKSVLKEELGLWKNDTTVKLLPTPDTAPTFDIEWDDDDEPDSAATATKRPAATPANKPKKGFKSVLNGIAKEGQRKTTDDFDFDDEDF